MLTMTSVKIRFLARFSLCSGLFWDLRGNRVFKNLQFCPLKPRSHVKIFNISNVGSFFPTLSLLAVYRVREAERKWQQVEPRVLLRVL